MENDRITVEQPASGQEEVWATTLEGYRAPLVAFARRLTRSWRDSGDIAEDIAQDAIIRVANALPSFDPARGSIGALLFATARRLYLNELRNRRSRAGKIDELTRIGKDAEDVMEEAHRDSANVEHLDKIFMRLTPRERGVLQAVIQEASYDVIAEKFGFNSAGHCRKFAHDLREKIRQRYATDFYL